MNNKKKENKYVTLSVRVTKEQYKCLKENNYYNSSEIIRELLDFYMSIQGDDKNDEQ